MVEKKDKYYCDYKYCSCPNKAIPPIKKDYLWKNKQRRFHKKCSFEVLSLNDIVINPKNLE